jgi:ribosomal protein L11 methyltransferase
MPRLYHLSIVVPTLNADSESDRYMALGAISITTSATENPSLSTLTLLATPKKWFQTVGITQSPQLLRTSEWKHTYHDERHGIELISGIHIVTSSKYTPSHTTPNDIYIWLDPRDAFGDGHHPTTQLCAEMIQDVHQKRPITTMLDLGCGTGILSILGKKLGISTVTAIDIELDSVKKTLRNAKKNHTPITVEAADVLTWESDSRYNLVVANLHTSIIEAAFPRLLPWVEPGGKLIISGISQQWKTEISKLIESYSMMAVVVEKGDWCGYLIRS